MRNSETLASSLRTVLFAATLVLAATASAQPSSGAIPRAADGHPDLSGTWDNGAGIDFVRPSKEGDSVCIFGCASGAPPPAAGPAPRQSSPQYRPEFAAPRRRSRQAAGPGRPGAALRRARRAAHRSARQDRAARRRSRVPLRGRLRQLLPHRADRRPAAPDEQRAELLGRCRRRTGKATRSSSRPRTSTIKPG